MKSYGRFLNSLFSLIADCSSALALVALSLIAAPLPALAGGLLMVAIYTVQHTVFQGIHTQLGEQSVELLKREQLALQQSLGAFREVRVAGRASYFLAQFRELQDAFRKTTFQFEFTRRLPPVLGELTIVLCVTVAVLVMMSAVAKPGEVTIALGLLAAVAFRLSPLANRVVGATGTIQNARAGLALLAAEVSAQRRASAATPGATRTPLSLRDKLELEGVGYTYPGRDNAALHDIDLTIRKGQVIGVVGASGAGKTTLIDIILGLLVPRQGRVLVDGTPIGAESHLNAGYVPQEIFLFDDTLRANIAFGAPTDEVDDDEIRRVLGLVRLDGLLQRLPQGLDAKLGERGRLLSGGQRQRVGIARALCHRPELLVLDEATSAMDVHTEERITDAIAALRGTITIIVIAHRLSTVRNCDAILLMDEGRIIDQGSFDDLHARNVTFRSMIRSASFGGEERAPEPASDLPETVDALQGSAQERRSRPR